MADAKAMDHKTDHDATNPVFNDLSQPVDAHFTSTKQYRPYRMRFSHHRREMPVALAKDTNSSIDQQASGPNMHLSLFRYGITSTTRVRSSQLPHWRKS